MATNIEQSICEAIDIIVNKAVAEASYDKTIQCTIVSCLDASIGKYKVKFQDSTFIAYSTDVDTTYSANTSVYVLVPSNDMNENKTILGSTKNLGANYVSALEPDEYYEINGNNIIVSSGSYSLCSYAGTQAIVLYSKDYSDAQNLLTIDKTAMKEYISNSGSIICGGYMRTELPAEQQYKGNYGIIFALDFMDNTGNNIVTRYYTIDVDNMTGNPYRLIYSTRQYGIFDIDAANFIEINYISLFCYDFPNSLPADQCVDDIFITDLELYGANLLSTDDLDNYSLTFITSKGTYFTEDSLDSDILPIEAQLRVKGKVVDTDTQNVPFYWGYEHAGVSLQSQYYCKYLGQGWRCTNNYNIIASTEEDEESVIEWVPSTCLYNVQKRNVVAQEIVYKCAVVYDDTVITKTITIKNFDSNYEITIESDSGTQFYFDVGSPTLTCLVNGVSNRGYSYTWSMIDNNGIYSALSDTVEDNEEYESVLAQYEALQAALKNGSALPAASQAQLEELEEQLAKFDTTMRVDQNIIYHLAINMIVSFSTFKCTVYSGDVYLGTASIALTNSLTAEGSYSLLINNGTYLYKYNESGVAPTSDAVDTPIETRALTFTIYDNLGNPIDDDVARHCTIEWIVPTTDTLLQIPDGYEPSSTTDGVAIYSGLMSLNYTIASMYDIAKTNNDISLYVNYKDMALYARTNLTFIKEGENGTNGTDYTCKLVPNAATGITPKYVILSQTGDSTNYTANFTPAGGTASGLYLRVEVYHNETRVYNGTTSGETEEQKQIDITWSILQNTYSSTSKYRDDSFLAIDKDTGKITYSGYNYRYSDDNENVHPPAHIVEVQVTSEGITNYATFPIITVRNTANYECELKEGSGFLYATYTSDGRNPSYDNVNPFEATVKRYVNGYWEDISTNTNDNYALKYEWHCLGGVYEVTSYNSHDQPEWSWVSTPYLEEKTLAYGLESNQYAAKPANEYTSECVTNALECIVTHKEGETDVEVTRMHIPVHLMLNRYGLAALNSWNGNSIEIDDEGGFILAPQVGAGVKENDNSFTGVIIGKTKESGMTSADVGLIGYAHGQRSIFLDAYTGKAEFGTTGRGQIIIDPGSDPEEQGTAQIKSGNFNYAPGTDEGQGMLIDLTIPAIVFGSGNFVVNDKGHITAKGGGNIAGFYIDDNSLWTLDASGKDTKENGHDDDTNFRISSYCIPEHEDNPTEEETSRAGQFTRNIGSNNRKNLVLASNTTFGVDLNGNLYAASGEFGSGQTTIVVGQNTKGSNYSALYYNKSAFKLDKLTDFAEGKTTPKVDDFGFYLGTDGLALGASYLTKTEDTNHNVTYYGPYSPFQVDVNGTLYARAGYIGAGETGWTIQDTYLYNGKTALNQQSNGVYIGVTGIGLGSGSEDKKSAFYVTDKGYLFAESGTIGGWTIAPGSLSYSDYDSNKKKNQITLSASTTQDDNNKTTYGGEIRGTGYDSEQNKHEWYIKGDGSAKFNNLTIAGGSISITNTTKGTVFKVDEDGNLTSNSGTIGGWTIAEKTLSAKHITLNSDGSISAGGGSNGTWSINSEGDANFSNVAITGGSLTIGDYFSVTSTGVIKANSGAIGGWSITTRGIEYEDTNGRIQIRTPNNDSGGYIRSQVKDGDSYSTRWYIYGNGKARFEDVYIAGGTLHLGKTEITESSFTIPSDAVVGSANGGSTSSSGTGLSDYVKNSASTVASDTFEEKITNPSFEIKENSVDWKEYDIIVLDDFKSNQTALHYSLKDISYMKSATATSPSTQTVVTSVSLRLAHQQAYLLAARTESGLNVSRNITDSHSYD